MTLNKTIINIITVPKEFPVEVSSRLVMLVHVVSFDQY